MGNVSQMVEPPLAKWIVVQVVCTGAHVSKTKKVAITKLGLGFSGMKHMRHTILNGECHANGRVWVVTYYLVNEWSFSNMQTSLCFQVRAFCAVVQVTLQRMLLALTGVLAMQLAVWLLERALEKSCM